MFYFDYQSRIYVIFIFKLWSGMKLPFKNKVSRTALGYEHAITHVLLVNPEARVLDELFFLFCVVLVLGHVPKIIILAILIVLLLVSSLVGLFFVVAMDFTFYNRPVYYQMIIFSLSELKFEFLDLLNVVLLLDLVLKHFMVLVLDDFLHFDLFFLQFLVLRVNVNH